MVFVDVVLVHLYEGLDLPDLVWASDIGCVSPWFAMWHGGIYKQRLFLLFELLMVVTLIPPRIS